MPDAGSLNLDHLAIGLVIGAIAVVFLTPAWRRPQPAIALAVGASALTATTLEGVSLESLLDAVGPWLWLLSAAVIVIAAVGLRRWTGAVSGRVPGLLLVVSAAGVWLAVPDTEAALVVLGTIIPLAVVGAVVESHDLPTVPVALWAAVVLDVVVWAAWGARGRPAALPGALACAGVLLVAHAWPRRTAGTWPVVAVHVAAVLAAARWASRTESVWVGTVRAALVVAATAAVLWLSATRRREPAHRSR